jgi:hypothetical protein
MRVLCSKRRLA